MIAGPLPPTIQAMGVSRETLERFEIYERLLLKWNSKINLVASSTLNKIWTRHFEDSAQLVRISKPSDQWVDLGSGAGFPGMAVAILLAELHPATKVVLVESDQRKSSFLRAVKRETGVKTEVLVSRIEALPPLNTDIVSARALAPLAKLLEYAKIHLSSEGHALFPKGATSEKEIEEALVHWEFDCERYKSSTVSNSVILKIGGIKRV